MKRTLPRKRGLDILDRFPRSSVLIIGDLMVDHFIWGRVSRISPEAPVPVVDVQSDQLLLGGAANVMNNVVAMGGHVHGVGVIGDDAMGQYLLGELRNRKIDIGGIVVEGARPTTLKTRIVAHSQQMVRFDRESRAHADLASIEKMVAYVRRNRKKIGTIVVSDYNKGVVSDGLLAGLRDAIAGTGILLCVDPKRTDFEVYRGADIITPNHHEAAKAVGFEIGDDASLMKAGAELLDRFDFKAVLITRGEEGMSLFERGRRVARTDFPAEAREVYDVTGAGDTAIGALALGLASGATFAEAAFLSNRAAGIAVGKVGTATVSCGELRRTL